MLTAAVAFAGGACDCGPTVAPVGHTVLTIDNPAPNATYASAETFSYQATAKNNLGISSLELHAGGNGVPDVVVKTCPGSASDISLTCQYDFVISAHSAQISKGQITLTAIAFDPHNIKATKTENILVSPIVVRFLLPQITAGTNPPVADVSGSSAVEVQVVSALMISAVGISYDNGTTLVQWRNNPTPPFSQTVNWQTLHGGLHHLTAQASDVMGNVDSDKRDVVVACQTDADCASDPGTRCCPTDGLCHQMVGENQDCDCQHPCQLDQGCFPGTCGATPQKCRPGCFPGSFETNMPADNCAKQGGLPAYCSPLPSDQVTTENKGGACAVGDNCDVVTQNCPEYPIDRTQPPGPNNPDVPQTCTPVAPNVNACIPAGPIALWGVNCNQDCTNTPVDCAKGSVCVTTVDETGNPVGPSECRQQCSDPSQGGMVSSPDCPANRPYCQGTYAAGMVYFSTGVCTEAPCLPGSNQCAQFSDTPCCNSNFVCDVAGCH